MHIRTDDLSDVRTRALVLAHLDDIYALTPAKSVHALGVEALRRPDVTVWSAWLEDELAGIGALAALDAERGEIKSMRVDDAHLGRGIGRALVRHIVAAARERGLRSLWLETGSSDDFLVARRLYLSEGFVTCPPFGSYAADPLSTFMTRRL